MEHTPGFDLTAAIGAWRGELLAHPGITPDDRRELESHLLDTIDESRGRGLDDSQAFSLASDRIGSIPQLAREFARADPAGIWRERAFWMVAALLSCKAWSIALMLYVAPNLRHLPGPLASLAFYLPIPCLAIFLSRGKIPGWISRTVGMINSRSRFVLVTAGVLLPLHLKSAALVFRGDPLHWILAQWLFVALWDILLIAMAAWFMPARYQCRIAADSAETIPVSAGWQREAWRERVFWMTLALLVEIVWLNFGIMSANALKAHYALSFSSDDLYDIPNLLLTQSLYFLFAYLPPLLLVMLLAHGRAVDFSAWLGRIFHSRARVIFTVTSAMVVLRAWYLAVYAHEYYPAKWQTVLWNFAFVALAAWLMPAPSRELPSSPEAAA